QGVGRPAWTADHDAECGSGITHLKIDRAKTFVSQESGWLARLIYPKNTDGGEMHERHTT
ncbi:MAG: hypothetical protein WB803_16015, partial [Pseudolabrys sp.]